MKTYRKYPFFADYVAQDDSEQKRQRVIVLARFKGRFRIRAITETRLTDIKQPIQAGQTARVRVSSVHVGN